jgi:hypothetical protein
MLHSRNYFYVTKHIGYPQVVDLPSGFIVSLRKPERHPVIRLNAVCQELPGHVRVDTSMSSSCDFLAPFPQS